MISKKITFMTDYKVIIVNKNENYKTQLEQHEEFEIKLGYWKLGNYQINI